MKITRINVEAKKQHHVPLSKDGRIYLVGILGAKGEHLRACFADRVYAISKDGAVDVGAAGESDYQLLGVVTGVEVEMF